jgi:hypothetical protein
VAAEVDRDRPADALGRARDKDDTWFGHGCGF